jgi:hypothetical protein
LGLRQETSLRLERFVFIRVIRIRQSVAAALETRQLLKQ